MYVPNSYGASCPWPSTGHSRGIKRRENKAARRRDATYALSGAAQGVSHEAKQINARICNVAKAGDIQALLNFVVTTLKDMSLVNMSTAMQKVTLLYKDASKKGQVDIDDQRFRALCCHANLALKRQVVEMQHGEPMPRCWSTIAWVYGSLQIRDAGAFHIGRIISHLSHPHICLFKPVELSNLLWGLAKIQACDKLLFRDAESYIEANLRSFPPINLSTIMWAFVKGGVTSPRFLQVSAGAFAARLPDDEIRPGHISNVLWAMATANVGPEPVLRELGIYSLHILPSFRLHELSIAAWAVSRLGYRFDNLFKGIAELLGASAQLRRQVHPQGAANLLWAFEKQCSLGSSAYPEIMWAVRALLPTCQQLLSQLKVHEYTCILRSLTKLGIRRGQCIEADQLFFTAARSANQYMSILSERDCGNLLETYDGFLRSPLSGSHDFAMAVPELVDTCLLSLSNVFLNVGSSEDPKWTEQAPCWCNLMEKMLALVSSFPPFHPEHRRRLFIQVAQLALQGDLDQLDVTAREQLAKLCVSVFTTEGLGVALSQLTRGCQKPKRVQKASQAAAMVPVATSEQSGCQHSRPRRSMNVVLRSPPVCDRDAGMKSEAVINRQYSLQGSVRCCMQDAVCAPSVPHIAPVPSETFTETQSAQVPHSHIRDAPLAQSDLCGHRDQQAVEQVVLERVAQNDSSSHGAAPPVWSQSDMGNAEVLPLCSQPDPAAQTLTSQSTLEEISSNLPYIVKNTFVEAETDAQIYMARRRLSASRFWTEKAKTSRVLDRKEPEEKPTTEATCVPLEELREQRSETRYIDSLDGRRELDARRHAPAEHPTWAAGPELGDGNAFKSNGADIGRRTFLELMDEDALEDDQRDGGRAPAQHPDQGLGPELKDGKPFKSNGADIVRRTFPEWMDDDSFPDVRLNRSRFVSAPLPCSAVTVDRDTFGPSSEVEDDQGVGGHVPAEHPTSAAWPQLRGGKAFKSNGADIERRTFPEWMDDDSFADVRLKRSRFVSAPLRCYAVTVDRDTFGPSSEVDEDHGDGGRAPAEHPMLAAWPQLRGGKAFKSNGADIVRRTCPEWMGDDSFADLRVKRSRFVSAPLRCYAVTLDRDAFGPSSEVEDDQGDDGHVPAEHPTSAAWAQLRVGKAFTSNGADIERRTFPEGMDGDVFADVRLQPSRFVSAPMPCYAVTVDRDLRAQQ